MGTRLSSAVTTAVLGAEGAAGVEEEEEEEDFAEVFPWIKFKISSFNTRPLGPVPGTVDKFTLFSLAILRTAGVVKTLSLCAVLSLVAGAGVEAAGAAGAGAAAAGFAGVFPASAGAAAPVSMSIKAAPTYVR